MHTYFFPRGVASVAAAGGGWEGGLDVSIITCPPWTAHCLALLRFGGVGARVFGEEEW